MARTQCIAQRGSWTAKHPSLGHVGVSPHFTWSWGTHSILACCVLSLCLCRDVESLVAAPLADLWCGHSAGTRLLGKKTHACPTSPLRATANRGSETVWCKRLLKICKSIASTKLASPRQEGEKLGKSYGRKFELLCLKRLHLEQQSKKVPGEGLAIHILIISSTKAKPYSVTENTKPSKILRFMATWNYLPPII